jgi:hypothetical protein
MLINENGFILSPPLLCLDLLCLFGFDGCTLDLRFAALATPFAGFTGAEAYSKYWACAGGLLCPTDFVTFTYALFLTCSGALVEVSLSWFLVLYT